MVCRSFSTSTRPRGPSDGLWPISARASTRRCEEKLKTPEFAPDFGPAAFVPSFGAMVTGARKFLVAYNVDLNVTDKRWANRVAFDVREMGRMVDGPDGKMVQQPGMLKAVRGMGWYIPEYGCAQVSMNLVDLDVTPVHVAFDACDESARERGIRVTGSELVGLIPRRSMLDAGRPLPDEDGAVSRGS